MPDKSTVPKKYRNFISPSLRRVFLDAQEDNSREVIENLNAEIAALKKRVTSLNRDKDLLMDRCDSESAHTSTRLRAEGRSTAHLASGKARADDNKLRDGPQITGTCEKPTWFNIGLTLFFFFVLVSMKLPMKLYYGSVGRQ